VTRVPGFQSRKHRFEYCAVHL